MITKNILWIVPLLTAAACLAGDSIQEYTIPKEHPAIGTAPGNQDSNADTAPIYWTLPGGWKELAPTGVRIGNFVVPGKDGQKAEVAVTSFPGTVGTELDNVNRWRREIGLEAVAQNEISAEQITVDRLEGKLYDLSGPATRTVVASVPRNGATWFFKLRGDADAVARSKRDFQNFLKSVRFGNGNVEATSSVVLPSAPSDPHAGMGIGMPQQPAEPKWNVPTNWKLGAASHMILKSFVIPGPSGQSAMAAISVFPGNVGGTLANVNRWRGQLGLAPIGRDELSTVIRRLDGVDNAVYVDLKGVVQRSSKPAGMVAVIVTRGENTWFYKLAGDQAVVATEKAAFLKFVQNVQYP